MPLKIDLHVHTCYSPDATTTLDEIVAYSKRRGLDGVAITDHDTVEGGLRLASSYDSNMIIIPGIEISTIQGHVLGINLRTQIPPQLTVEETVEKIHDAGGLAVVPHPSAIYKGGLGLDEKIVELGFDAVEVTNSAAIPFFLLTYLNRKFAQSIGFPQTAGSDSHMPETIGLSYTSIIAPQSEPIAEDVVEAIRRGKTTPFGEGIPWTLRLRKIRKNDKKGQLLGLTHLI